MTARSQRRAAELAVIEAARAILQSQWDPIGEPFLDAMLDVEGTLRELDALGLADPGRARANKGAPVTAQQAAIWMNGDRARSVCARIIRLLWNGGYQYTMTTEQIEYALNGKHQTISPRINELRDAGWIVDAGHTRKTTSGREAIVWSLSTAARQAINGQEGMPI